METPVRADQPQRLPAGRGVDRRLRGRSRQGRAASSTPPPTDEVVFTKNATEALNLVAPLLGPGQPARRRRRRAHPHGAPRQHRAVAHARRRAGHRAALGPAHRRRPARPHRPRPAARRRQGLLASPRCRTCSARSHRCATSTDAAHAAGALAIVDACQFVPHNVTDVQAMGADFLAFSSHKMCGPSGIGVLWGREALLDAMPPFLGGGNMIADVRLDGFTSAELPAKFEAGTPPITEAVGLGAAIDFLTGSGMAESVATRSSWPATPSTPCRSATATTSPSTGPTEPRGPGRHPELRVPRHPSARHLARCSTRPTCTSGPGTTAPSR